VARNTHLEPKPPRAEPSCELSFEQALAGLEDVIRDLEDGRLELTESLNRYEEGVRLLKYCHVALNLAERKILLLTGVDAEGKPITEPFDDQALSLEEKKESRVRRRSRPVRPGTDGSDVDDSTAVPEVHAVDAQNGDVDRQKGLF
jgi:exodeoxyribonuclease VII small subunit